MYVCVCSASVVPRGNRRPGASCVSCVSTLGAGPPVSHAECVSHLVSVGHVLRRFPCPH